MINISQHFRYYEHIKDEMPGFRQVQHPVIQDLRNQLGYDESNQDQRISAHQLLKYLNSVLANNTTAFSTSSATNAFLHQVIYEVIQDHPDLDSFSKDANQSDITQQLDDIIDDLQTGEPVIFKTITRNHTMLRLLELINQKTESELTNTDLVKHLSNKLQALDDEQLNLLIKMFSPSSGFYQSNFDQDHYFWTNAKIPLDYMEVILNEPQNACKIIQILDPETRAYLQPSPLLYLNQLLFENGIDINNVHQNIQNDQQRGLVSAFLTYMLQIIIKVLSHSYRDNPIANKQIHKNLKELILDIPNITDQTYSKYHKLLTSAKASGILTEHPEFFQYTIDYADEYDIDYAQLIFALDHQTEHGSRLLQNYLKKPLLGIDFTWRSHQIQQYYDYYEPDNLSDTTRYNLDTFVNAKRLQFLTFCKLAYNEEVKNLLEKSPKSFFEDSRKLLLCQHIAIKANTNSETNEAYSSIEPININDLLKIIQKFSQIEAFFANLDEHATQHNLQNFQRLEGHQQNKLIAALTYYQVTSDELEELITLQTSCFECTSALDSILHFWKNHDIDLTRLITRVNNLTAEATNLLVNNLKTNSPYHTQLVNSILKAHPISTPDSSTNTENTDQHVANVNAQKLFSEADVINSVPCIDLVNNNTMQSSNAVVTLDKDLLDDQTILQGLQEKYAIDINSSVTNNNPFINMAYLKWLMSKLNSSSDTAPTPRHPITRQLLHLKEISDSHININLLKTYLQDYHKSTYFQQRLATVLLIDDLLQAKASLVKAMHEANSANQINSGAMYPQLTEQGADINEAIQQLNSSSDIYDMQTHFINILNKMDQAHTLSHFATQLGPYHASLANTVASLCHTRKNANDSDTQPGITLKDMTQHYTLTADDRILAASNQGCYENTHNDENTHNAAASPSF